MTIDWTFIERLEGRRTLTGYVPSPETSMSGVTIASGVDLGQRSAADIRRWGLADELTLRLSPYAGLKRQDAVAALDRQPLVITEDEAAAIDAVVRGPIVTALASAFEAASGTAFDALPDPAQTVLASLAFQYGPALATRTPKFWAAATALDWPLCVAELEHFGDAYPTRRHQEAERLRSLGLA